MEAEIHARHKLLFWKIAWDTLPTGNRLNVIGSTSATSIDNYCYFGNSEPETTEHIFLKCPISQILWRTSCFPLSLNCTHPYTIHEFLKAIIHPGEKLSILQEEAHHFQIYAAVAFDQIWHLRNKVRLNPSLRIDPIQLSRTISRTSTEYFQAWRNLSNLFLRHSNTIAQAKPAFQIQFDAAIKSNVSMAALICLNSTGSIIAAQTQCLPEISDPLLAEANAILLATKLSLSMALNSLLIEGDSSIVIAALREEEPDIQWPILNAISTSLSILSSIPQWSARKISRVQNSKGHTLAQWALTHRFSDHIPFSFFGSIWKFGGTEPP